LDKYQILKSVFGHTTFRDGQEPLIDALMDSRDAFGIMPTGAGKSVCYQVPALLKPGLTLVVSPLISLMKDQVEALRQMGVEADYLNSSLSAFEFTNTLRRAAAGHCKLLYVAPERLLTERFLNFAHHTPIAMLTVDEAHCVSQWGQDFRPAYLDIPRFVEALPERPPIGAFTATATQRVRRDIVELLGLREPETVVTGFDRPNLRFEALRPRRKYEALRDILMERAGSCGVVYCSTRKTVEELCEKLCEEGFSVTRYHAGLTDEERKRNQEDFLFDRRRIVVATNAFGTGIDKSNVNFVVHYNMPRDMESYYQEAGRAGRDGAPASCILLFGEQDVYVNEFLIEKSNEQAEVPPDIRAELLQRDLDRLQKMTDYAKGSGCLREKLLRYFGEKPSARCGNCSWCGIADEQLDVTIASQKILSCIYRMRQREKGGGSAVICEILHGDRTPKVLREGFETLSTFGIMNDMPVERILDILRLLIDDGCARREGDPAVLVLTERADDVLYGRRRVYMPIRRNLFSMQGDAASSSVQVPFFDSRESGARPDRVLDHSTKDLAALERAASEKAAARPKKEKQRAEANDLLLKRLRVLRQALAAKAGVPPFTIFSDAVLLEICRRLPRTEAAFSDLPGIGEVKTKRYAKSVTKLVNEFCEGR